jgi:hypothetical protein
MDLDRYISELKGIVEEIVDEFDFDESGCALFEKELRSAGFENWLRFKRDKHPIVIDFISSTPSQRSKLKKFQKYYFFIALAAYQECIGTIWMIESMSKRNLLSGLPYRKFAGLASETFFETAHASTDCEVPWGEFSFDAETYA